MVGQRTDELEQSDRVLRREFEHAIATSRLGGDRGLLAAVEASLFGDATWAATGRYRPLRVRGRGAYGTVYEALDTELDRRVALKVVRRRERDTEPHARMQAEARAIARVSHPNVVQVYDVAWEDGRLQIAMELVHGRDLAQWLADPRTWQEVVDLMIGVGHGLAAIHDAGLVHRDFKPGNVLVGDDGVPRIADFGLARLLDREEEITTRELPTLTTSGPDLTGTGLIVGTPAYMAPEQHAGSRVTEAADQYAFCITLWEALTGRRPFASSSLRELGEHKLAMRLPMQRPEGLPRDLIAIVRRGLQPDPRARHASMRVLCEALAATRKPRSRKRWWLAGVGVLGLAGAAIAATREDPCRQGSQAMDAIWSPARAREIAAELEDAKFSRAAWGSIEPRIDDYASRWREGYDLACHGRSDSAAFSPALECLKRRRDDLASFVELVAEGDADVLASAAETVDGLPDPRACRHAVDNAWSPPAEEAAIVEALRSELARARAEAMAGRSERSLHRALDVIAQARSLRFRAPYLEARVVAGRAERTLGRRDAAVGLLEEAAFEAVAAGFDEIALEAMTAALQCRVEARSLEAAELWAEQAISVAARIDVPRRESELETALAQLAWEQQDRNGAILRLVALLDRPSDALPALARYRVLLQLGSFEAELGDDDAANRWLDRAEQVVIEDDGPDHIPIAEIEGRRAMLAARRGKIAEAKEHVAKAKAVTRELPSRHPAMGYTLLREGVVHLIAGEFAEAIVSFRPACSMLAVDPDAQPLRECLTNLASAYSDAGRPEEAIATARRGLARAESPSAPDYRVMVTLQLIIADADRALGDLAQAQEDYERAVELIDAHLPGHPRAAWASSRLGDLALERDDPAAAERHFRTALAQLQKGEREEFHANVRFGLARALWSTSEDHTEAIALAREALSMIATSEAKFAVDLRPKIEAWLAARSRGA